MRALMWRTNRRSLLISSACFFGVLFGIEALTRASERQLATGDEAVYWQKLDKVQGRRLDVLVLGDSTAHQGISPEELLPLGSVFNAGLQSESGIVAESLARSAAPAPRLLVYAGILPQVADTWEPQRHERALMTFGQRAAWSPGAADLVLGGVSRFYLRRNQIRARVLSPRAPKRNVLQGETALGWLPQAPYERTLDERNALARDKLGLWFGVTSSGEVRLSALRQTMLTWADPTSRLLLIMPMSSSIRNALAARPETSLMHARWRALAESTNSSLLDCMQAMPDETFHDDDHLDSNGARTFSRRLLAFIQERQVPVGCTVAR